MIHVPGVGTEEAGARIEISNPASLLEIDWTRKNYCLIAGGIGITPLVLMAQTLAKRGAPVRLVQGARTASELAYGDVLRAALGVVWHQRIALGRVGRLRRRAL